MLLSVTDKLINKSKKRCRARCTDRSRNKSKKLKKKKDEKTIFWSENPLRKWKIIKLTGLAYDLTFD